MCLGARWDRGAVLCLWLGAALALPACKRTALTPQDGGGGHGGSQIDAAPDGAPRDATGETATVDEVGSARDASGENAALDAAGDAAGGDTALDAAGDAPAEVMPPPGMIPCGTFFCDPSEWFCVHYIGGLLNGRRECMRLPAGCADRGHDCSCVPDASLFCYECRVVTGGDTTGIEQDCQGPLD